MVLEMMVFLAAKEKEPREEALNASEGVCFSVRPHQMVS